MVKKEERAGRGLVPCTAKPGGAKEETCFSIAARCRAIDGDIAA